MIFKLALKVQMSIQGRNFALGLQKRINYCYHEYTLTFVQKCQDITRLYTLKGVLQDTSQSRPIKRKP